MFNKRVSLTLTPKIPQPHGHNPNHKDIQMSLWCETIIRRKISTRSLVHHHKNCSKHEIRNMIWNSTCWCISNG
uniref:Uncharacterized protein n=1 Tax=Arundo donax TaxID=35708 RepID=A0A0A9DGJ6_ARUDO